MEVSRGPLGSATFSPCLRYRYLLTRGDGARAIAFVMLNPASADATRDDRTIAQCRKFAARAARARRWPSWRLLVVNLYALRTPSPRVLFRADDPIGPRNDELLIETASSADLLICAWGRHGRRAEVLASLTGPRHCLGLNLDGSPRHPARLADRTRLRRF